MTGGGRSRGRVERRRRDEGSEVEERPEGAERNKGRAAGSPQMGGKGLGREITS